MAWNEPGGGDKDPWSGGRGGDQGPPDLDEVFRQFRRRFGGLFGGGGPRRGGGGGGSATGIGFGFLLGIALLVWLASGIYIVDEAERGIVLRLGRYTQTVGPGPHWHIPYPVEQVFKVNVKRVDEVKHRAQMLTKDVNLVQMTVSVQYKVIDPKAYLFSVRDPEYTLQEVTESALREVVGTKTLDEILSKAGGRDVVVQEMEKNVQALLESYNTGLQVVKVNMESPQPPQAVQAAFQDAIKAEEDEDRYKKQAEAYERDIIPKAEGEAQRIVQEAEGYKQMVIDNARGETSQFLQTLKAYREAPEISRRRLYIETMEAVLSSVSKVVIDVDESGNLLYLPLDRMLGVDSAAGNSSSGSPLFRSPPPLASGSRTNGNGRRAGTPLREGR